MNFVMSDPVPTRPLSSEESALPTPSVPAVLPATNSWGEHIFRGPDGLRLVWRILIYLAVGCGVAYALLWLGRSFFPEPHGSATLWQIMYGEAALAVAAVAPAFLLGRIEGRPVDDYGLPRRQALGRLFWVGALWGLAAITLLLIAMRASHVFYFGHVTLHGMRVLKFAAFWGVFFVLVGIFEDFLFRGYLLFAAAPVTGFWPAAVLLSCAFGAIHLNNAGEAPLGALGAGAIGLFFCLTLRRTGNLWFAIGFHAAWDWGETYLYAVPNSGTRPPGHLLSSSFVGNEWLTGGTVGPEGSIFCFVLLVLLWVVFDWMYPTAKYTLSAPIGRTERETLPLSITQ